MKMELELKDVITYGLIVLSFVVTYWKNKLDMEKRLTKSDVQREDLAGQVEDLKKEFKELVQKDEKHAKENQIRFEAINAKLAELVTAQATNSVFLQENLKNLTALVQKHDEFIDSYLKNNKG